VLDRNSSHLYCKIFGIAPPGYETANNDERDEVARERVRLWYVAATRARELLVLPRFSTGVEKGTWLEIAGFDLATLPALDLTQLAGTSPASADIRHNSQSEALFANEAQSMVAASKRLKWLAPSRDEDPAASLEMLEEATALGMGEDEAPELSRLDIIRGGRERGLVIHKLLEEILRSRSDRYRHNAAAGYKNKHVLRSRSKRPDGDDILEWIETHRSWLGLPALQRPDQRNSVSRSTATRSVALARRDWRNRIMGFARASAPETSPLQTRIDWVEEAFSLNASERALLGLLALFARSEPVRQLVAAVNGELKSVKLQRGHAMNEIAPLFDAKMRHSDLSEFCACMTNAPDLLAPDGTTLPVQGPFFADDARTDHARLYTRFRHGGTPNKTSRLCPARRKYWANGC